MKAKALFTGRLTRDVISVYANTDGSAKRALFTVACNSVYKAGDGQKVKQVDFIPCIAWGVHADLLQKWGLKGRQVLIVGTIETYQKPPDADGQYEPTKVQIRISEIEFLGFEDNVRQKFEEQKKATGTQTAADVQNQTQNPAAAAAAALLAQAGPEAITQLLLGALGVAQPQNTAQPQTRSEAQGQEAADELSNLV